ncbi:hypothetical protein MJO29_002034 [Puccinia striiformis f. sp. tritici]|nr:hypothetical protein MJO29_002034 [Puccinia striiformis f. sp. tritici]
MERASAGQRQKVDTSNAKCKMSGMQRAESPTPAFRVTFVISTPTRSLSAFLVDDLSTREQRDAPIHPASCISRGAPMSLLLKPWTRGRVRGAQLS